MPDLVKWKMMVEDAVNLKVALYAFFGTRGIDKNGANAPVFKKNLYFDNVTKNKGFWVI